MGSEHVALSFHVVIITLTLLNLHTLYRCFGSLNPTDFDESDILGDGEARSRTFLDSTTYSAGFLKDRSIIALSSGASCVLSALKTDADATAVHCFGSPSRTGSNIVAVAQPMYPGGPFQIPLSSAPSQTADQCAVLKNGELYCWGAMAMSAGGDGTLLRITLPGVTAPEVTFKQVAHGFDSRGEFRGPFNKIACAIVEDTRVGSPAAGVYW